MTVQIEPIKAAAESPPSGWRLSRHDDQRSLSEVYATVPVPMGASWVRRLLAFSGPGYMVSVGYMDPGNWATDIAGGSKFGYTLLAVIMISNLMAILLQALSARLGIATGRDLAQACRDAYPKPVGYVLWFICELAIIACDLAEVIGTAIALKLLFGIPLVAGALITALDVFLVLMLMNKGFRYIEAFIISLLVVIAICFAIQIALAAPPIPGGARRLCAVARDRAEPGDALHRDRHPRRHRDAAQSLPAFLDRADAPVHARRGRQAPRHPLGNHRQHDRADAGAVCQFGDPDHGSERISRQRTHRRRRDRGGLRAALATARRRRRINAVRGCAAGIGSEFDRYRDPRRPDRDGRLLEPAAAALGAPAGYARHRHRPGRDRYRRFTASRAPGGCWCSVRSSCRCNCRLR